jgi:hypothetical protein
MRRMSLRLPLAAFVAVLTSCATTVGEKAVLSVELYDMRTYEPTAPARQLPEAPRLVEPTWTIGAAQGAGGLEVPVVSDAPPARTMPQPLPMQLPPVPRPETFPQKAVPLEIADTTTRRGGLVAAAPRLAIPEAPVLPASKAKPTGAVAPTGAAAPAAAPQKLAPVSTTTPAAESSSRVREIFARQGDELQVGLEGQGFLFLGFGNQPGQSDGMSFKGKETRDKKSYFSFKALKYGTYDLGFLQQDNATGKSIRETVRVHVVPESEFTAAVEGGLAPSSAAAAGVQGTAAGGDYQYAERLASLGAREAALAEFLKGYAEGNGYLNDRIAFLYLTGGDLDAAEKYYQKNLTLSGSSAETGVLGMVRIALAREDARGLLSYLKPFLAIEELSIEEQLIQAARLELRTGGTGVGLEFLAEYAKRYPEGKWRDEASWLTGQLHEANSPMRDIAKARESYSELLRAFPESAFANLARERVRYINEHFFIIR